LKERILAALEGYQEEIAHFTLELVRLPTENPPGALYRPCIEAIGARLGELGFPYQIHEIEGAPPEHPRFWLQSYCGSGERSLCFHGHYDVVPADSPEQFQPERKRNLLFGRGSSDMKGGLAAMIYALRALADCNIPLDGRVCLNVVPDEETGGRFGSAGLGTQLTAGAVGMLTAEPTAGVVWNASRGAISLRVRIKGRPSHVGLHYRGVNAFEQMLVAADALLDLKREVELRQTEFRIAPPAARGSILLLGGECSGGRNFNVVPGECSFTVDRRINPEEDLAAEKARLLAVLAGVREKGIDLEVDLLQEGSAAGTSEEHPLARDLARSVEEVTGKAAEFALCPGLLEIRFYAPAGIPALAYGPGLLSVSHGPHEFVSLDAIRTAAAVYALTAARHLAPTAA
jgi:succinyl-diaminopimelate desuccinylase